MILLAFVAVGEALHSAGISLPQRPTAAALAAVPWVLFLIGFGLGLLVLKYQRRVRVMARAAYRGQPSEAVTGTDGKKPPLDKQNARPAWWNADPDVADVRIVNAEPKRDSPSPSQQAGAKDARLSSAPDNGHRHGHGHGHHSGPLD
jgi:hypothetical protein